MIDVAQLDWNDFSACEDEAVCDFLTVYWQDGKPLIIEFEDGEYYSLIRNLEVTDSETDSCKDQKLNS